MDWGWEGAWVLGLQQEDACGHFPAGLWVPGNEAVCSQPSERDRWGSGLLGCGEGGARRPVQG